MPQNDADQWNIACPPKLGRAARSEAGRANALCLDRFVALLVSP